MFLKADNVGAERMCSGSLLQATGPATQNARVHYVLSFKYCSKSFAKLLRYEVLIHPGFLASEKYSM